MKTMAEALDALEGMVRQHCSSSWERIEGTHRVEEQVYRSSHLSANTRAFDALVHNGYAEYRGSPIGRTAAIALKSDKLRRGEQEEPCKHDNHFTPPMTRIGGTPIYTAVCVDCMHSVSVKGSESGEYLSPDSAAYRHALAAQAINKLKRQGDTTP